MDRAEIRHETKSRARPEGCVIWRGWLMVWREDGCVSGSARRCEEVEPTPWYVLWGATTARLEMDQRIFHNGPFERPGRSIRLFSGVTLASIGCVQGKQESSNATPEYGLHLCLKIGCSNHQVDNWKPSLV
ncbi:hypothetical protein M0657_007577 [Pyricularia oryzae]|nr:hypothetical protein M9X92_008615 [Pyricularia oryzae]KAI7918456.1 hypothetical protein M0657_007577 [Pyricularia oryzae]